MIIRQSLWSFEPSLHEEIGFDVSRKASKRQLGSKFGSVAIVRTDRGLALDFFFLGSDRHSARRESWALIRQVASDVYTRSRVQLHKRLRTTFGSGPDYAHW